MYTAPWVSIRICRGEFASFRTHAGASSRGLGRDDRGVPSWLLRRDRMTSLGDA
jgi:hypothetical protein